MRSMKFLLPILVVMILISVSGCININQDDNESSNDTSNTNTDDNTDNEQDTQNDPISSSAAQNIANNYAQKYVPGAYPGSASLSGNIYTVPFYGNGALVGEVYVSRSTGKITDSWFQEPITEQDLQ